MPGERAVVRAIPAPGGATDGRTGGWPSGTSNVGARQTSADETGMGQGCVIARFCVGLLMTAGTVSVEPLSDAKTMQTGTCVPKLRTRILTG